jgi:ribosomal protein L11 methyltransferase
MKINSIPSFWWSIHIPCERITEIMQSQLFDMGAVGFYETDPILTVYFESASFNNSSDIIRKIKILLPDLKTITVNKIKQENWNENWKKNFRLTRITNQLVIRPSWIQYRKKSKEIVITIDPKMGFGTGTHETTQLMLRLMEKYLNNTPRILDVGTGSGILAIAACKMGSEKVYAFDVDEEAIENAKENMRINRCENKLKLHTGKIETLPKNWPKAYDAVLVNIQRSVIAEILPDLIKKTKPDGLIILSGILQEELHMMYQLFKNHYLIPFKTLSKNDWLGFVVRVM